MGRAGLIILCLFLFGCKTKYIPVETTVREVTTVRDTTIEYQLVPYRDSVQTRDTMSYLSNEYGGSWAVYSEGILSHSLFVFPQRPITIDVPKTIVTEKVTEGTKIETVEVEKKLTFYQKTCVFCFPIFIFAMIIILIARFLRKKVV